MEKQGMVAGGNLGGSGADPAADMGLIQNLLSQDTEAFHLLLVHQHLLLPALAEEEPSLMLGYWLILDISILHLLLAHTRYINIAFVGQYARKMRIGLKNHLRQFKNSVVIKQFVHQT